LDDDDVVADGKVAKVTPITGHPEAGGRHGVALAHAA
jgi:hypothetical protein